MDLSTRRRNAMDKPQMNPNQNKPQHRSSRVSASPSRPTHAKKQLPSNQRRTEVSSAASPSSPTKEGQNSLKKSGTNRVFVDSSRSPFADYHHSVHSETVCIHLGRTHRCTLYIDKPCVLLKRAILSSRRNLAFTGL